MASSENDRAGVPLTRRQMRERAMSQEPSQAGASEGAGQHEAAPLSRRAMREHSLDQDARESVGPRPAPAPRPSAAPAPQGPGRPAAPATPAQRPAATRPQQGTPARPQQATHAPVGRPGAVPPGGAQTPPSLQRPAAATAPPQQGVRAPLEPRQTPTRAPQQQSRLPQRPVEPPSRTAQTAARAQADRAAAQARQSQAPVVAPPPVTGAVRRIDESGRLTPAVAVSSDGVPAVEPDPRLASAQPNRVGVRDAVAKAQENTAPRVYPAGTTPYPAEPNQPSRLNSQPARPSAPRTPVPHGSAPHGSAAPTVQAPHQQAPAQGWSPMAAGQAPAGAGQGAPLGQQPAPARPSESVQPQPTAPAPRSFAPAAEPQAETGVPSWDAVLGGGAEPPVADASPFSPVASPEQPVEETADEPVSSDSWLGYTPFHYVILVVIGLVLGFVCWQLLSATSDSGAEAAQAVVAVVQGPSPGFV